MSLNLWFELELCFDENAYVIKLPEKLEEVIRELNDKLKSGEINGKDIDFPFKSVKTNIYEIYNEDENENIEDSKEYRRRWKRLWEFFDLKELQEKCFPPRGLWEITGQDKEFLKKYLEKDYLVLDGRKKKYDDSERKIIQEIAMNLYRMIQQRIGITDDIRNKFYNATKDMYYETEKKYAEINEALAGIRNWVFEEENPQKLNILEKQLWMTEFEDELNRIIYEWKNIFRTMQEMKYSEEKYQGIVNAKHLLKDTKARIQNN